MFKENVFQILELIIFDFIYFFINIVIIINIKNPIKISNILH